ncbi:ATP-grasp domain-containing protein [Candidatus Zixiibacteriota bacterium]
MNVLLSCAGRRVYLLKYFQEALNGRGIVVSTDASPHAPTMKLADKYEIVPMVGADDYIDVLLEVCIKHRIGLLCSLNDLDLTVLSANHDRFREVGVQLVVSDPESIDICFDKWKTQQFIAEHQLPTIPTWLLLENAESALKNGESSFPLVVKPRWGSASIGIEYAHNVEELRLAYSLSHYRIKRTTLADYHVSDQDRSILIQSKLPGHEFGLDIVNDLSGTTQAVLVKKKMGMRAGETECAVTVQNRQLEELGWKIGRALKHVGNMDCDVFLEEGQEPYVLEMNPRFGGGYPFSHIAGADVPRALLAWAIGEPVDPDWLTVRPNIVGAKYDMLVNW